MTVEEQVQSEVEAWTPDPQTWYACTLKSSWPEKRFIVGELSTADLVFIHERDVSYSGSGGHTLCLPLGTEMSVRMQFGRPGSSYQFMALECQIGGECKAVRESATVERWRDNCGSVRRPCGCSIFAKAGNNRNDGFFNEGETVTIDVVYSDIRGNYMGEVVLGQ